MLAERGYIRGDKTSVRLARLDRRRDRPIAAVEIAAAPSAAWLDAFQRWHGLDHGRAQAHAAILVAIPHPAGFAALRDAGAIVAVGVVIAQGGYACLNDIATDPSRRRRSFARRLVDALMDWAQRRGADHAYLQVVKTNRPALALYGALGFDRELYRYSYRIKPVEAPGETAKASSAIAL